MFYKIFSEFPGLPPNITKCKTARIGALKSITVALCRLKCLNLVMNVLKSWQHIP